MFNGNYELGSEAFKVVEEIGRHMPGGFFIYKAEQPEEILYANKTVFEIFGCQDLAEFQELTGYTFKGMVHPDDYKAISSSIDEQIEKSSECMDYVEYRIIRRDGKVRWVDDYGHFSNTKTHGGVYFVFISDITEKRERVKEEAEARIRQQQLEEKIALQERLLEQSEATRQALKAAEEANRAKTNFLSNMSHEIRTPITAILGMNELIRRESHDKNILEYTHNIGAAGTSLLSIINDILDFSKIEAGRMELIEAEYDTRTLISDLANLVKFRLEEKGLIFRLEIDPSLPTRLFGDELRLKQVITNLLTNAAKYTEKGTVTLKMQVTHKKGHDVSIEVAVKDTGIGIKDEELGKLFSAFDRLDVIRTRSIEGTGLGLAISSRMLKLMGADLQVQSTYGQGSVFSFTVGQQIVDSTEIGEFDLGSTPIIGETVKKHLSFLAPTARVLLVDDTPLNLKVIVGLLKKTQLLTETTASGRECIEKFGATDYDIIFLDYRMPEMDGIETLKKLYELYPEKAKATPIVCLTASAIAGDRERMLKAGFDDYLPKPVNILDMERMMIHYLPKEKVQLVTEEGTATPPPEETSDILPTALFELEAIDPVSGIEYCGSEEDYMETLSIFSASIGSKSKKIEKAWQEQDLKNYTILVHSLKSTSRIVGAKSLSDLAFQLEMAGKEANNSLIAEKTPGLLEMYRSLQEPLEEIVEAWEDK